MRQISFFKNTTDWGKAYGEALRLPKVGIPGLRFRDVRESLTKAESVGLECCPREWKMFYVRCLISLALRTSNRLSSRETAELRIIMSNLKLNSRERILLCERFNQAAEEIEPGTFEGLTEQQADWVETFKFCLLKDLIRIHALDSNDDPAQDAFIQSVKDALGFGCLHLDAAKAVIKTEVDLLEGREPAPVLEQTAKKSLSLVTGAGLPVAAIFYSGSVTGLSASGIVSGLASIGTIWTALGVAPMVGGLVTVGAVGVGSAIGVHALSDAVFGKKQREAVRESMRKQAIDALQLSMSELAADVSLLTRDLNAAVADQDILISRVEALALRDKLVASQGSIEERLQNV